jgi:hypothetical protein
VDHRGRLAQHGVTLVRGGQSAQGTHADGGGHGPRHPLAPGPVGAQEAGQVDPLHPLGDQAVGGVDVLDEVDHLHHVGVGQLGADPGLLDEHGHVGALVDQRGLHLLDRDRPDEARGAVHARAPHHRHAALTGELEQLVLPGHATAAVGVCGDSHDPAVYAWRRGSDLSIRPR